MIGGLIVHRQFGLWPAFAQATPLHEGRQQFINRTETGANKVGLPSWRPSSETGTTSEQSRFHEPFLWQEYLHIG